MNVGVARTLYRDETSNALLRSTLMSTALSPASSASSSYVGYTILQGAQVEEVKKIQAQEFVARESCSSNSLRVVTFLTYPLICCGAGAVGC